MPVTAGCIAGDGAVLQVGACQNIVVNSIATSGYCSNECTF